MPTRGAGTAPERTITSVTKGISRDKEHLENISVKEDAILHELAHMKDERNMLATELRALQTRVMDLESDRVATETHIKSEEKELEKVFRQLAAGGLAGAFARSIVCPIDRVKILRQTQYLSSGGGAEKYKGIAQTMRTVVAEQGLAGLWRGNMANCVRVIPYSGLQFAGYGWFKENLFGIQEKDAKLTVPQRLTCGASAAMVATSFTHPLDLVRLRLAVQPELKGTMDAFRSIWVEGGIRAYFKGLAPTLISLSPFIAINFATFDTLKDVVFGDIPREQQSKLTVLGLGATAGLFAQTICYPLDTVRRRMQMKGNAYSSVLNAFQTILKVEGSAGFYRGFTANAMKVVPNNGLRFMAFDFLKDKLMKKDDE